MQWVGFDWHVSISSSSPHFCSFPHKMSELSLSMVNHIHRSETTGFQFMSADHWLNPSGLKPLVLVNLLTAVPGPRWKMVVSSFA